MRASNYATLVFDCDGVILDSNRIKTEAFRQAAMPYGPEAAEALVEYHVANGGISRYAKFDYFLSEIVAEQQGPDLWALLTSYSAAVREGLMHCDVTGRLNLLRDATPETRWLIVSGGDQRELREVFSSRGLDDYFDGGVFGSPDRKDVIICREIERGNINHPALFLGDSRFDFQAAQRGGLHFVFVSKWTELEGWEAFVEENGLRHVQYAADILTSN